jgi:hypothetical protein
MHERPCGQVPSETVVPANPDHIDKLGVVAYYSIAVRALVHGANHLTFRLVSEPCCAPAGDSRATPPTRSPLMLREAVETDARGSPLVGMARTVWQDWQSGVFIMKAATVLGWHRKGFAFLDVEDSTWQAGAAGGSEGSSRTDSHDEPRKSGLAARGNSRETCDLTNVSGVYTAWPWEPARNASDRKTFGWSPARLWAHRRMPFTTG